MRLTQVHLIQREMGKGVKVPELMQRQLKAAVNMRPAKPQPVERIRDINIKREPERLSPRYLDSLPDVNLTGSEPEQLMKVAQWVADGIKPDVDPDVVWRTKLELLHYAQHVRCTIEAGLRGAMLFSGLRDVTVVCLENQRLRVTLSLRQMMEWPDGITYETYGHNNRLESAKERWGQVFREVKRMLCPHVFERPVSEGTEDFEIVVPERECDAYATLYLVDSRATALELMEYGLTVTRRSEIMDDTTRTDLLHPVLLDYINEVGDLKDSDTGPYVYDPEYKSPPKGQGDEPLFENGKLDDVESLDRSKFAERLANLQVKSKLTYTSIRDRLFKWLMKRDDMTVHLAALHARSAARGFLLNAVGTDLLVTASIRQWRQLVEDNERPDADAGMQVLAGEVKQVLAL